MDERLRVLAIDVGTGTQDILLFESDRTIENCFQMILPSPTVIVAARIRAATAAGRQLLLTGRTMGGGPCAWAARDHALAGLACYATADAARTLDDDLTAVQALGITILDETEAQRLLQMGNEEPLHVVMRDIDVGALRTAFATVGIDPAVDAIAIAAFDHGAAPPGYSDRRFRFEHIERAVRVRPEPLAFAYHAESLPADLTRLTAVVAEAATYDPERALPVFVMDTGAAAVAGALEDRVVAAQEECLIANIGNFHTLAFHLRHGRIRALFEHHTGELTQAQLEGYLRDLAAGTLDNERVFAESGHGALRLGAEGDASAPHAHGVVPFLAVTGPRRELLRGSALAPYEAVPHGDMMLAGCFGLLRAVEALEPAYAAAIDGVLGMPGAAK